MKKAIFVVLTLFTGISVFGKTNYIQQNSNQLTASYKGYTEDGGYKFVDAQNNTYIFQEIDYDIDIDLYDDAYLNKNFKITWEEVEADEYDDEGEPTGETIKVKRITSLTQVK